MALYICKNLLTTADYVRTASGNYSSVQSLLRAGKNGHVRVLSISGLRFVGATHDSVQQLHDIKAWESLPTVSYIQLPEGLEALSRISKNIGVGESAILGWALLNRMDAYWIGGHFAALSNEAQQIAATEKRRKASAVRASKRS